MFKVKVFTTGKVHSGWLKEAIEMYEKRLTGKMQISWELFANEQKLFQNVVKHPFIALDPNGTLLDSVQWSKKMIQTGSQLNFLIGSSEAIPKEILKQASFIWSLSPLTFTHQMARLILIEQLYRALQIDQNTKYHK